MGSARLQLMGDVVLEHPRRGRVPVRGRQPRAALALLALERGRVVTKEELAELLWGDRLPAHWAGAVRGVVSKVRSALALADLEGLLRSSSDGWVLDTHDGLVVDLDEADGLLALAERLLGDGDPEGAIQPAAAAAGLLEGELAPAAPGARLEQARQSLDALRRRAELVASRAALASGRPGAALEPALRLLGLDPYDEGAARLAARSLAASGDRQGGIRLLEQFRDRLSDELDVHPQAETRDLLRALRRGVGNGSDAARIVPTDSTPIFGRDSERRVLEGALADLVHHGAAQLVIVSGEPGSGKTRLAMDLAGLATADGLRVLWSRCSPDRRVGYEPVAQLCAGVLAHDDAALAPLGPLSAGIHALLPDSAGTDAVAGVHERDTRDPRDQTTVFRSAAALLAAALVRPTVVVVDDLQWASGDTTALLTHLVDVLAAAPVLTIVTSRGHDAGVSAFLETASRSIPTQELTLRGLDEPAVIQMLAAAGVDAPAAVGAAVRERTGGNPFFISQLLADRPSDAALDPDSMPSSLRSWLGARVATLESAPADALAAAAVLDPDLDVATLAAVAGLDPLDLVRASEQLVGLHLLVDDPASGLRFAHALTRDAVLERMGTARREVLHGRAADVLADRPAATRAHHLLLAGPRRVAEAVDAAIAAGESALGAAAWSTAAGWFGTAVERAGDDTRRRARALVGTGHAQRGLGDRPAARAALEEALRLADRVGDRRLAAMATYGLVGGGARGVADDLPDERRAALLRAALDGLDDDGLRVLLGIELAVALLLSDEVAEREALAADAVERARRLGRPDLLCRALLGQRVAQLDPALVETRLAAVDHVLAVGPPDRSAEVTLQALMARHEDLLLCGDREGAATALDMATAALTQHDHPYWRWVVATWQALALVIAGDLEAAEQAAVDAMGHQPAHPEALACLGVNLVDIRLLQGRSGEVTDLLADAADENPRIPCYRAVLALCLAEAGELGAARGEYETFASRDFSNLPRDTNWLLGISVLADVAATLGDVGGARALVPMLAPHSDRQVLLNCYAGGGAWWGPVATQVGRLHLVLGDEDAATRLLDRAAHSARAMGNAALGDRIHGYRPG